MRVMKKPDRSKLMQAALQQVPCDLTVSNVKFVNMFTGEVYDADVDVLDGFVVRVREKGEQNALPSKENYDGKGAYLVPGFIDTHIHIESTMMTPENFGWSVLPWGTTTVCTDPHEIANVMGIEGVEFMLKNARNTPLRQYALAPSCVPSVPAFENAGAVFMAKEVGQLLDMDDVIGVAEVMDTPGAYHNDPRMQGIIHEGLKRNMYIQGHAPATFGKELSAYRLAGPQSDHESYGADDVRAKLRVGIYINLRASSITDTLKDLVQGCKDHLWRDLVTVCTDDKYAKDILKTGLTNYVVGQIIACGINPVEAYKLATFNAAREYGLDDLGVLAPGYLADMQLVRELDGRQPEAVFIEGRLVAKDGACVSKDAPKPLRDFPNTMNLKQITSPDDFKMKAPDWAKDRVKVNIIKRGVDVVHKNDMDTVELPVKDGYVSLDEHPNYMFLCVANRHGTGDKTITIYDGFGLNSGAFATTVSHDCHNLTVAYRSEADAFAVTEALKACGGGMAACDGGDVTILKLPIAGLMSQKPALELTEEIEALNAQYHKQRSDQQSVMKTVTMSLACTPRMVTTDRGMVNGREQKFVDIFVK